MGHALRKIRRVSLWLSYLVPVFVLSHSNLVRAGIIIPLEELRTGDVVFHTSRSQSAPFIMKGSNSPFSHVGVVLRHDGGTTILEAVEPVKETSLKSFLVRGRGSYAVILRLRQIHDEPNRILENYRKYLGRPYDIYYEPGLERIYCSELIFDLFKTAYGIEIGEWQKLKELYIEGMEPDIIERYRSAPGVRRAIQEQGLALGSGTILEKALETALISPASFYDGLLREGAEVIYNSYPEEIPLHSLPYFPSSGLATTFIQQGIVATPKSSRVSRQPSSLLRQIKSLVFGSP